MDCYWNQWAGFGEGQIFHRVMRRHRQVNGVSAQNGSWMMLATGPLHFSIARLSLRSSPTCPLSFLNHFQSPMHIMFFECALSFVCATTNEIIPSGVWSFHFSSLFLIHRLHSLFYDCLTLGWIKNGAHSVARLNNGLWSFSVPDLLYYAFFSNALLSSPLLCTPKAPCWQLF